MITLPKRWSKLKYHKKQYQFWTTKKQFIVAAAGRGSGKTEIARRRQVRWLPIQYPHLEQPLHGYALPTYSQARRVAWGEIKSLIPPKWISKVSEMEMSIETTFGSKLYVLGLDKPERAEGVQWSTFVIDESCDQKPEVFDKSILPALSHNCDWCARIGVPKRRGPGAITFRRAFEAALIDEDSLALHWPSSDIVDPKKLHWAKNNLDPQDYKEQYNAEFTDGVGGVYYTFDSVKSVTENAAYHSMQPILVGQDFNVDPMCWVLAHFIDGCLWVFDEIHIKHTNTKRTLDYLHKHYGTHQGGWMFTGDASSKARKSSADLSDYAQIYIDERFGGPDKKRVVYPMNNPSINSRIMTVNAAFLNANDVRRVFIHPRCHNLIIDLGIQYKPGTREVDEAYGGHITDALGYLIMYFLPIRLDHAGTSAVISV